MMGPVTFGESVPSWSADEARPLWANWPPVRWAWMFGRA